jgi:hypothetical protein
MRLNGKRAILHYLGKAPSNARAWTLSRLRYRTAIYRISRTSANRGYWAISGELDAVDRQNGASVAGCDAAKLLQDATTERRSQAVGLLGGVVSPTVRPHNVARGVYGPLGPHAGRDRTRRRRARMTHRGNLKAPPGHVAVPIPKAILVLTEAEYRRGILRGKWRKRQVKMKGRSQGDHGASDAPRLAG